MYLLDANVFIQAKNLHYGFDFCPAFWSWLDREHASDRVFSIEGVLDELAAGGDDLATWAQARRGLFLRPDTGTVPSLSATSTWASGQQYDPAAVNTFLHPLEVMEQITYLRAGRASGTPSRARCSRRSVSACSRSCVSSEATALGSLGCDQ
jgi:hypothetical protein